MKKILITALAGLLLLPALPGGTQSSITYVGESSTDGLSITITDQGLRTGITTSRVQSASTEACAGVACATAAGAAEPLGTTVSAMTPGEGNPPPAEAFSIGGDLDPQLEQAIAGSLGSASATTTDAPSAAAEANGLGLDVTLVQTIVNQLPPELTGPLNDGIGQIADGLAPIAENDPTGVVGGLTDTLTGLLGSLGASPLMSINGADSTSGSTFTSGVVTAEAQAAGAVLVLLPAPDNSPLLPQGLAVIEGGPSVVSARADATNPATAEASASIVRITLFPGILDALPDLQLPPEEGGGLPDLGTIIDMLPPEIADLLPPELTGPLGGGGPTEEPSPEPTPQPTSTETEGPTGTPIDDLLPPGQSSAAFMQADEASGGFVIELATGAPETCILEGTPLETCVLVGGTDTTATDDGLGIGVLAAGVNISALRMEGQGTLNISFGRAEAGVNAQPVQQVSPTVAPTPTPQTGLPQTGGGSTFVLPALVLMGLSGVSLLTLRRRRSE